MKISGCVTPRMSTRPVAFSQDTPIFLFFESQRKLVNAVRIRTRVLILTDCHYSIFRLAIALQETFPLGVALRNAENPEAKGNTDNATNEKRPGTCPDQRRPDWRIVL